MENHTAEMAICQDAHSAEQRIGFPSSPWIRDKGMRVLRFHSDLHPLTPVDLFATEPFPFEEAYSNATVRELSDAGSIRVVALHTLKQMKQEAGRPQDLADLDNLELRKGRTDG